MPSSEDISQLLGDIPQNFAELPNEVSSHCNPYCTLLVHQQTMLAFYQESWPVYHGRD